MINGVLVKPLKQIIGDRGRILKLMRSDDENFEKFGEVYFSTVPYGAIKDWHTHKKTVLNYAVPYGEVKLVLYDGRKSSPTFGQIEEIYLGEHNYSLVRIPPGVISAFKGLFEPQSFLINCSTEPHSEEDIIRFPPGSSEIPYDWSKGN